MRRVHFVLAIIVGIIFSGTACAQEKPVTSAEVFVPEGSALFRSAGLAVPVWCGSKVVAFPGAELIYYDLEQKKTAVEEILLGKEGEIAACSADRSERLTVVWDTDAQTVGTFSLVSTISKRATTLVRAARFFSADSKLRKFIFGMYGESWPNWSGRLELVTATLVGSDIDINRSQKFGNASPGSVSFASVSADGKTIAYAVRTTADGTRWSDPSALDVILAPFDQQTSVRLAMDRLLRSADKATALFFDQDRLIIVGASDEEKLVAAACPITARSVRECRSVLTELDAAKFVVLGVGQTGFIFGNNKYDGGSRACIFETSEGALRDVPSTCRMEGPSAPVYGQYGPETFFVLSPDNQHVAVLSKYRPSPNDPMATVGEWAIVPTARYRTR